MGLGQVWSRALVYFGIVEEDEYWDEEAYAAEEELERRYAEPANANVRRLGASPLPGRVRGLVGAGARRRRGEDRRPTPGGRAARPSRPSHRPPSASTSSCRGASTTRNPSPTSSRTRCPSSSTSRARTSSSPKRLIDFSSGLTYALNGGMQRVADKVFLLTPRNVEVSAEERARLIERGFFNQSSALGPA